MTTTTAQHTRRRRGAANGSRGTAAVSGAIHNFKWQQLPTRKRAALPERVYRGVSGETIEESELRGDPTGEVIAVHAIYGTGRVGYVVTYTLSLYSGVPWIVRNAVELGRQREYERRGSIRFILQRRAVRALQPVLHRDDDQQGVRRAMVWTSRYLALCDALWETQPGDQLHTAISRRIQHAAGRRLV